MSGFGLSFLLPGSPDKPGGSGRAKIFVLAALLSILAAILFQPALDGYRLLKIKRFVASAQAGLAQGNWTEAAGSAARALTLDPYQPQALRVMATALSALDDPEAIPYWNAIIARSDVTEADRSAYVALAIRLKRADLAERQMAGLLAAGHKSVETLRLAASYFDLSGDASRAANYARAVLAQDPEDRGTLFLLGRLSLAAKNPEDVGRGKMILASFLTGTNYYSIEAMRLLGESGRLVAIEAADLAQRLEKHPLREPRDELILAELRIGVTPYKSREIIAGMATNAPAMDGQTRLELGRWLNRRQAFAETVASLTLQEAMKSKDHLLVLLDAKAALGQWQELDVLLSRDDLPLEPVLQTLFQARAASELKRDRIAELLWDKCQAQAASNQQALVFVAQYAEKMGERNQAIRACRKLLELSPRYRPAYEALVRLEEPKGDTRLLRNLLREMGRVFPDDPVPRNDVAYLNLLLNEDLQSSLAQAEELARDYPAYIAYKVTLALAHHRLGNARKALEVLEQLPIQWEQALPGWQAVCLSVLASNGLRDKASELLRHIVLGKLKAEERLLIQPWIPTQG